MKRPQLSYLSVVYDVVQPPSVRVMCLQATLQYVVPASANGTETSYADGSGSGSPQLPEHHADALPTSTTK